jgi:hypothetical protein
VALAAAGALVGCSGSSSPSPTAPTVASARAVLAAQGAAVRAHTPAAFLATFDAATAARAYRTEQAQEFANLAKVPFALWRYQIVGPIHVATAVRATTKRYGTPTLLLHVTLGYELRGVDKTPSTHDLYLIFVRRHGKTVLAGDDPLTAQSTVSWVGPWHYGPLDVASGKASLVLGPPADQAQLPGLATDIDTAIAAVTRVWGTAWSQRVAALVPASTAEFTALSGSASTDVSAAAVTDGIDSGTGQPFGQRLVLNPAELGQLSATGRGIVLRHEITHLATAADTADITPRWVVEGFADYVGNLDSGQSVPAAAAELHAAVAAGTVPTALPTDKAFAATGAELARDYEASWLACRLIAHQVGQAGLVRFYRAIGTALEPQAEAVADAFRTVLHETQAAFTAQWWPYLKHEVG